MSSAATLGTATMQGYPLFDEDEGRSLILSRTALGEDSVQGAIATGYLTAEGSRH